MNTSPLRLLMWRQSFSFYSHNYNSARFHQKQFQEFMPNRQRLILVWMGVVRRKPEIRLVHYNNNPWESTIISSKKSMLLSPLWYKDKRKKLSILVTLNIWYEFYCLSCCFSLLLKTSIEPSPMLLKRQESYVFKSLPTSLLI